MTIRNGSRTGTYKAFAEKYVDDKLSVLTFTHVNKVIFKGKTALGIEVFPKIITISISSFSYRCQGLVALLNILQEKKLFFQLEQLDLHRY